MISLGFLCNVSRRARRSGLLGGGLLVALLAVRWTTSIAPCTLERALLHALARRDEKTRAYTRALALVIAGLTAYVLSVSLLLLAVPPKPG